MLVMDWVYKIEFLRPRILANIDLRNGSRAQKPMLNYDFKIQVLKTRAGDITTTQSISSSLPIEGSAHQVIL